MNENIVALIVATLAFVSSLAGAWITACSNKAMFGRYFFNPFRRPRHVTVIDEVKLTNVTNSGAEFEVVKSHKEVQ